MKRTRKLCIVILVVPLVVFLGCVWQLSLGDATADISAGVNRNQVDAREMQVSDVIDAQLNVPTSQPATSQPTTRPSK